MVANKMIVVENLQLQMLGAYSYPFPNVIKRRTKPTVDISHYRLTDSFKFMCVGDKNQLNGGLFDNSTYRTLHINIAGTIPS